MNRIKWIESAGWRHRIKVLVGTIKDFLISVIFMYGYIYTSYKYGNPLFGRNDFFNYKEMIGDPWNFSATIAPFVLRQVPTIVASGFYDFGVRYDTTTVVDLIGVDPDTKRRFFALILSSGLAVCLSFTILARYLRARSFGNGMINLFALFGMFAAWFYFPSGVISPLACAWGWLASALFVIAFLERSVLLTFVACLIATFSRETTMIFALVVFLARLVFEDDRCRRDALSALVLIVSSLFYLTMRALLPGNEHQIDPQSLLDGLMSFRPSRDFIFQSFLSQGLLVVLLVGIAVRCARHAAYLSLAAAVVTIVGIATKESRLALLYGETLPFYALIFLLAQQGKLNLVATPTIEDSSRGA